eukprot:11557830-Alexandrium_andersonii.AAC.1
MCIRDRVKPPQGAFNLSFSRLQPTAALIDLNDSGDDATQPDEPPANSLFAPSHRSQCSGSRSQQAPSQ